MLEQTKRLKDAFKKYGIGRSAVSVRTPRNSVGEYELPEIQLREYNDDLTDLERLLAVLAVRAENSFWSKWQNKRVMAFGVHVLIGKYSVSILMNTDFDARDRLVVSDLRDDSVSTFDSWTRCKDADELYATVEGMVGQ